jgi:hypothetical protein
VLGQELFDGLLRRRLVLGFFLSLDERGVGRQREFGDALQLVKGRENYLCECYAQR